MNFPYHPAPGLGDLAKGFFVVPQNPIMPDSTPLVPSIQATAPGKIIQIPRMGDLVAASFVVPQNPLIPGGGGLKGLGCGCGFGCDGGANYYGLNGLGALDTSSVSAFFSSVPTWLSEPSPVAALPNWGFYGGIAVGAMVLFGASQSGGRKRK